MSLLPQNEVNEYEDVGVEEQVCNEAMGFKEVCTEKWVKQTNCDCKKVTK
jgi:hypothetical protein